MDTPIRASVVHEFKTKEIEVCKGRIVNLVDLGALNTIWGTLGNTQANGLFRVQEVLKVLEKDDHFDNVTMNRVIKQYMKKIQENDLDLVITLDFLPELGYRCIDGNKRSTAYFEYMKSRRSETIDFPVYILRFQG